MKKSSIGKALSLLIPLFIIFVLFIFRHTDFDIIIRGFFKGRIINVIIAVILVQVFSKTLKIGEFDTKLESAIRMITKSKRLTLVIPSLMFGLLPMPAGALVSAPFTEKAASHLNLTKQKTFFINYWFRHVWEYSWPLYAGVILGSGFLKISIGKFALLQSPLVMVSILAGLIPLYFWTKHHPQKTHSDFETFRYNTVVEVFFPIVLLFILTLLLRVNINISLLFSIASIYFMSHIPIAKFFPSLKRSVFSFTTFLIITVLFLKTVIEKTGALSPLYQSLVKSGIPPVLVGIGIAFISGFFTGITQASVGITFPVFLGMLLKNLYLVPVLYTVGFMGVMLSPFHLCYLTTKEYFKVSTRETYTLILPISIFMIAISLVYLII